MRGINKQTGKSLSGIEHLKQSIEDILTTPIGSRVMRRDYGSRLFALIDSPLTVANVVEIQAAAAEALDKWEPRIELSQVKLVSVSDGKMTFEITGKVTETGEILTVETAA